MGELIIFLILIALGYSFGRYAEDRHYKSIILRESQTLYLPIVTLKTVPEATYDDAFLVEGNVVISIDYFKRILASLRNIFGGRISSYETLIDRARREAVLRMKEQAIGKNAKMIFNVRLETSSISKSSGKRNVGSVEVLAWGTAVTIEKQ